MVIIQHATTSVSSAPAPEADVRAEFNSSEETLEAAGRLLNWISCNCNRVRVEFNSSETLGAAERLTHVYVTPIETQH